MLLQLVVGWCLAAASEPVQPPPPPLKLEWPLTVLDAGAKDVVFEGASVTLDGAAGWFLLAESFPGINVVVTKDTKPEKLDETVRRLKEVYDLNVAVVSDRNLGGLDAASRELIAATIANRTVGDAGVAKEAPASLSATFFNSYAMGRDEVDAPAWTEMGVILCKDKVGPAIWAAASAAGIRDIYLARTTATNRARAAIATFIAGRTENTEAGTVTTAKAVLKGVSTELWRSPFDEQYALAMMTAPPELAEKATEACPMGNKKRTFYNWKRATFPGELARGLPPWLAEPNLVVDDATLRARLSVIAETPLEAYAIAEDVIGGGLKRALAAEKARAEKPECFQALPPAAVGDGEVYVDASGVLHFRRVLDVAAYTKDCKKLRRAWLQTLQAPSEWSRAIGSHPRQDALLSYGAERKVDAPKGLDVEVFSRPGAAEQAKERALTLLQRDLADRLQPIVKRISDEETKLALAAEKAKKKSKKGTPTPVSGAFDAKAATARVLTAVKIAESARVSFLSPTSRGAYVRASIDYPSVCKAVKDTERALDAISVEQCAADLGR